MACNGLQYGLMVIISLMVINGFMVIVGVMVIWPLNIGVKYQQLSKCDNWAVVKALMGLILSGDISYAVTIMK